MEFERVVGNRCTIRYFNSWQPVEPATIQKILLDAICNSGANLVVQGFLVHNGINVFGELACRPGGRARVVREQGEQQGSRRS